jgi:hypothetical protein
VDSIEAAAQERLELRRKGLGNSPKAIAKTENWIA